ncbi:peptidoglycan recognition family protein [Streptomyces sp. NPDC046557]|uniref:peptidoglycan recognition protein family protein n=1 Tax=Streptomyces sp. NPDC046557 TaxID=3155372 RepID=UPI0033C8FF75
MVIHPGRPSLETAPSRLISRRIALGSVLGLAPTVWAPAARASERVRSVAGIIDCEGWGARPPAEDVVVLASPPRRIVVHHTATRNLEDFSLGRALALARAVQNLHMDTRGWIDTGQHFTVSRGAYVTEGRHRSLAELNEGLRQVRSAHCVGQNDVAVGIETEGTYTGVEPPPQQFEALAELCAYVCGRYGLDPAEIRGHRDFNDTACPGDRLYALLPRLRDEVAARLR